MFRVAQPLLTSWTIRLVSAFAKDVGSNQYWIVVVAWIIHDGNGSKLHSHLSAKSDIYYSGTNTA
jgi:hypothetical protein